MHSPKGNSVINPNDHQGVFWKDTGIYTQQAAQGADLLNRGYKKGILGLQMFKHVRRRKIDDWWRSQPSNTDSLYMTSYM